MAKSKKAEITGPPELGDLCKDKVTGFKGIISCYAVYLTGCDRVLLQGKADKSGQSYTLWSDIGAVEILEKKAIDPESLQTIAGQPTPTAKGGPQNHAPPI